MIDTELIALLEKVKGGAVSTADALAELQNASFGKTELPFAELDHHRGLRHGLGEVIYGESKSTDQIITIAEHLSHDGQTVLITRLNAEKLAALELSFPAGRINAVGRTFTVNPKTPRGPETGEPFVAILAAGTADSYAAEEACEVCAAMNTAFEKFYDVGVAGLHRLLDKRDQMQKASALVVVAGMEGALPSVVGGLFGKPLFAVPTSVGYGTSFGGVAALLAMLNSCAAGVTVVNIDNGFSAGYAACQVIREIKRATESNG